MKISELQKFLAAVKKEHGDLDIYCKNPPIKVGMNIDKPIDELTEDLVEVRELKAVGEFDKPHYGNPTVLKRRFYIKSLHGNHPSNIDKKVLRIN